MFTKPLCALAMALLFELGGAFSGGAAVATPGLPLLDGIVTPRRPLAEALRDAIQFLRKADGAYVPGKMEGELAGYFSSALVKPDGTRSDRQLFFPARQHAYFIRTFLHYYEYTGEREWLQRALDLADWNLAHSTPAEAAYPRLPYSAYQDGKPTGSNDQNSTEPDKAAFMGTAYLQLYECTAETRYLSGARQIAETLIAKQRADGSWPFRVIPGDGSVFQDLGGAPVFYAEFFERFLRLEPKAAYEQAGERARQLMLARNVEQGRWGTYHEDIPSKDGSHLSAEPMSFTAAYLFRHAAEHPAYLEMGQRVLRQMEERLVFTTGHAAAPAPAVAEQATFAHIMPGHTARYCWALAEEYRVTHDPALRLRGLSGLNATTYMQAPAGIFRTFFYDTKMETGQDSGRPDWYSQHLYTVCHLLECMAAFPEIVPAGEDHLLSSSAALHEISYAPGRVRYASRAPVATTAKLNFTPRAVTLGGQPLAAVPHPTRESPGWNFDAASGVLEIAHGPGTLQINQTEP